MGSILDKKEGTEADIKARIGKVQNAFNNICRSKEISIRTKLRLFNPNVKSVLIYESETWSTTNPLMNLSAMLTEKITEHRQKNERQKSIETTV